MNPYFRLGSIGWVGALLVSYFAYTVPPTNESYMLIVVVAAVFGAIAYAARPKDIVQAIPAVEGPPQGAGLALNGASLDEMKVFSDTAKELAKSRGDADIDLTMQGGTLRLGKPRGELSRPDDGLPSTTSGTLEAD